MTSKSLILEVQDPEQFLMVFAKPVARDRSKNTTMTSIILRTPLDRHADLRRNRSQKLRDCFRDL